MQRNDFLMLKEMREQAASSGRTQHKLISTVLSPIVGILLRAGVPYQTFATMARRLYVDIARDQFGIRGRKTNISRVAMLTGLSRTLVRAAINEIEQENAYPGGDGETGLDDLRHLSRILLGWHLDRRFLDELGQPAALAVERQEHGYSFQDIYDDYSGNLAPASAMLKELLEVGSVEQLDDGRVIARSRQYIPDRADAASLERVCQVINDLASTAGHNLHKSATVESRVERIATNQQVPAAKEAEFRAFLAEEGQGFLERVDNWLSEAEKTNPFGQRKRIGVGLYQISSEPIEQSETSQKTK